MEHCPPGYVLIIDGQFGLNLSRCRCSAGTNQSYQGVNNCNDEEFTVNPAATEVCGDGLDNDCDGDTNQQNAQNCSNFYLDSDGDGYGVSGSTQCWCEPTYPYTGVNTDDCYDNNADAYPGASSYHQVHRGDGSYDYNCDNNQERRHVSPDVAV